MSIMIVLLPSVCTLEFDFAVNGVHVRNLCIRGDLVSPEFRGSFLVKLPCGFFVHVAGYLDRAVGE
jgi:hypothetical protein